MIKKYYAAFFTAAVLSFCGLNGQVIYEENFSGAVLVNNVAHLPAGFSSVKVDTFANNPDVLNAPFNDPGYATDGWALKTINGDTCAVATAALAQGNTAERWLFTPVITGITTGSKLIWKDAVFTPYTRNSTITYQVRITTDTSSPAMISQFSAPANLLATIPAGLDHFSTRSINLSAFAGMPVRIAFQMNVINTPIANWQVLLDDLTIFNTSSVINMANDGLFAEPFSAAGDSLEVIGSFRNLDAIIHGYTWHVRIGNFFHDSIVMPDTMNPAQDAFHVMHLQLPPVAPGVYVVKSWISSVHSVSQQPDYYPQNDTLTTQIRILASAAVKHVLVEEFTGAWCGDCPEGGVAMDTMLLLRPWAIPVSIHTGDSMTLENGNTIATYYNAGYPSITTDRINMVEDSYYWGDYDLNGWGRVIDNRHMHASPASVSVFNQHYDWTTRELTVVVGVTFYNDAEGDFRLNCWLTENNVFGPEGDSTDNHWNNHSYNTANPASAFYGMGTLLDPSEYRHDHVLNVMLSDLWGDDGIIPDTVYAGNTFVQTYTYTLPVQAGDASRWKPLDISAVAFVSTYDDFLHSQSIVNAGSANAVTGIVNEIRDEQLAVYPNPTDGNVTIDLALAGNAPAQIEMYSFDGKLISSTTTNGESKITLDLSTYAAGMYFLKVNAPGFSTACKIIRY